MQDYHEGSTREEGPPPGRLIGWVFVLLLFSFALAPCIIVGATSLVEMATTVG